MHVWKLIYPSAYLKRRFANLRKYLLLPAAFGRRHNTAVRYLGFLPTRVQFLVIGIHCLMNFLFLCFGYNIVVPNPYYMDRKTLQIDFLSHRTGIMSFGQLPLVFLFASRNNFLIWLTGWSFSTFNVYHRWVARTMFLNAAIHSVCWTIYAIRFDALRTYYIKPYWICGVVALCLACFMLIQGWHVLRRTAYQIFLALHILFTVLFIFASWYHVNFFYGGFGYTEWLKVSIGFWVFDRIVRLGRMVAMGWVRTATVEIRGKDVCRIEVPCSKLLKVYPGAHCFLYSMVLCGFWQSHPFSVFRSNVANEEHKIIILSRRKKGMTQKIFLRAEGHAMSLPTIPSIAKFIVEGPYGHHETTIVEYDSILLIAGGVGITAVFPWAVELSQTNRGEHKRVVLRWYVHDEDALMWLPRELEALVQTGRVDVLIYQTGDAGETSFTTKLKGGATDEDDAEEMTEELKVATGQSQTVKGLSESVRVVSARPPVENLVNEIVSATEGSVAVMVSGPPEMNDAVRESVVRNVGRAKGRVEFFDETFGW